MVEFLQFQSIVQYRVPVNADGSLGQPEILKKFTTEMSHTTATKAKKQTKRVTTTLGQVVEL